PIFLGQVAAIDHAQIDGLLGGSLDLRDLGDVEAFLERGAHDGVRLLLVQMAVGPTNCRKGHVNVAAKPRFVLRHSSAPLTPPHTTAGPPADSPCAKWY